MSAEGPYTLDVKRMMQIALEGSVERRTLCTAWITLIRKNLLASVDVARKIWTRILLKS